MASSVELWTDGTQRWSVRHQGDNDTRDLTATGQLPPEFTAIRDAFAAKQDHGESGELSVDWYFELPLELAKRITGFRHDEELPSGAEGFVELRAVEGSPARQPWWKFW